MAYKNYVISTVSYGLIAGTGAISLIFFLIQKNIFLSIISLLIVIVSLDNFFCGCRIEKTCSIKVKSHYAIPPFLKRKS